MQETWVPSLGWEDPLEKKMATHSSILAWKTSWTEEPGGLQSMGSQRVRHNWVTNTYLLHGAHIVLAADNKLASNWLLLCCLVAKSCPTLCEPMDCSTPGFPVHYLLEFAQIHVHWVSDVIQPSHPLSSPSPFCLQYFPASESFPVGHFFPSGG